MPASDGSSSSPHRPVVSTCPHHPARCLRVSQCFKKVHPKVRNHGEGPYQGLLLVESGYYRFHLKTLLRHYAKRALTPRSLYLKLGPRRNYHKRRADALVRTLSVITNLRIDLFEALVSECPCRAASCDCSTSAAGTSADGRSPESPRPETLQRIQSPPYREYLKMFRI